MTIGKFEPFGSLLTGGLTVTSAADMGDGGDPRHISTLIQIDGDILNRVSPALLDKPPDALAADLARHHEAVIVAMRPLIILKRLVDGVGGAAGTVGAGFAAGSAARTVTATTSDPSHVALMFGLGLVGIATAFGIRVPIMANGVTRLLVVAVIRAERSGLIRLLGRSRASRF